MSTKALPAPHTHTTSGVPPSFRELGGGAGNQPVSGTLYLCFVGGWENLGMRDRAENPIVGHLLVLVLSTRRFPHHTQTTRGFPPAFRHAPAPAHPRLTAGNTPSPLRPLDAHIGGYAHLHSPTVAHQRQHTTPPPIASPRDNAGGSDDVAPHALVPAPPRLTADGTPSPLGPLDARIGGHSRTRLGPT